MTTPDAKSFADRIEQFILFLDAGERVLPLNRHAEKLLSSLAAEGALFRALFNVESYAEVRVLAASAKRKIATRVARDGRIAPLYWEFASFKNGVLAFAADACGVEERGDEARKSSPLENLIYSILPERIVEKLVAQKTVRPKAYSHTTIMFTDVVNFSLLSSKMDPVSLIHRLNFYFSLYDEVMEEFAIEKIKTIGDSYMSVSGIPEKKPSHAVDCCLAALTILYHMEKTSRQPENRSGGLDLNNWSIRMGIHTGGCIAGVVGFKKYTYDIWGDSVNIASRMEKAGVPDKINVSEDTAEEVRDLFTCEYRGIQEIKNIGPKGMHFLNRISPELSEDEQGYFPNKRFNELYCEKFVGRARTKNLAVLPVFMRNYLKTREGGLP
ncbi:MAG: adenylate/guanylate cyclase domain-containing protein [Spirochaetia bacterium]|jgi:class 3 adenylate cyclase